MKLEIKNVDIQLRVTRAALEMALEMVASYGATIYGLAYYEIRKSIAYPENARLQNVTNSMTVDCVQTARR